jgi:hypothetical protein
MRIGLVLACVSLPGVAFALRLEGEAQFRAVGKCFTARGAAPLGPTRSEPFRLHKRIAKGTVMVVLDYDIKSGACAFELFQPPFPGPVFEGRCYDHPRGFPLPLQPVRDPRDGKELLPVIVGDAVGFGGLNGYLVFPPGGLPEGVAPLGLSGRFLYTTTYVPPVGVGYSSRWFFGGSGPFTQRCLYTGTLRLGDVAAY